MVETFLITGGAGFIGSHLTRSLIDRGACVVVADNFATGSSDNLVPGADFIYIDLANEHHYYKLDECRPTAIIHMAGQSSGEISHESPVADLEINAKATLLLGKWAIKQGCKRFLYASTVSVYGDGTPKKNMAETDAPAPKSFYACAKLASENYLKILDDSYGLRSTSFRFFNVYGPGQNMTNMKQGMVSIYLAYILRSNVLEIKGALDRYRDFIYISDIVDLLIQCIDDQRSFGRIFNVGTGIKTRVDELVRLLLETTGKPEFPVKQLASTQGDAFGSCADISYIKKILGWQPKVTLQEGIRRMVEFYS